MTDGVPPAAPAAPVDAIAAAAAAAAAAAPPSAPAAIAAPAAGDPPAIKEAAPSNGVHPWMNGLPTELQSDATLRRFDSIEALARGHIEAHRTAKAKIPVSGDEMPDTFESFVAMRPKDAADYTIEVPEGSDAAYAEGFRGKAFEIGLHPKQAQALVEWQNVQAQAQIDASRTHNTQVATDWRAAETAAGRNPDATLTEIGTMLSKFGITSADATALTIAELETSYGTAPTLNLLSGMARMLGEPPRIDGDGGQRIDLSRMPPDAAKKTLAGKMLNTEWARKAQSEGSTENLEYRQLNRAAGGS